MSKFPYPEGSVWRKCDLHIHGPDDVLNNQFQGSSNEEKWENYINKLADSEIETIAFTNYFCIEGYEKIIDYKNKGRLPNIHSIFANIEFRLSSQNKDSDEINVHIIFNDKIKTTKITDFLNRLELQNTGSNKETLYCKLEDLRKIGFQRAFINDNKLFEQLEKDFRVNEDYFIVFPCNGYGSMRPNQRDRSIVLAEEYDKKSSFFFGKKENRDFYLNKRFEGSIKKAVVLGSDAHKIEDIGKNYTWIKADPTFNGFRQIIFEPEDRVFIADNMPDKKLPYTVIKSLRFSDNTGDNLFSGDIISINPKLTTIIGGKSTGKSLLLFYAAKTIDSKEVTKRLGVDAREGYKLDSNSNFDFEVVWEDTTIQKLKEQKSSKPEGKQIVYIPQAFLNRLSEEEKSSQDTLNEFVLSVLLQDSEAQEAYELHLHNVRNAESHINSMSDQIFGLRKNEDHLLEQIKEIGNYDSIKLLISEINIEIEKIRLQSGLTVEDATKLESLSIQEANLRRDLHNAESDEKIVIQHNQKFISDTKQIKKFTENDLDLLNLIDTKQIFQEQITKFDLFISDISIINKKLIDSIGKQTEELNRKLVDIEYQIKPLNDRLNLSAEINKKEKFKREEEGKLTKIDTFLKQLESCRKQLQHSIFDLKTKILDIFNSYKSIQVDFKKYESKLDDIVLNIQVQLNGKDFVDSLVECLGKTILKREGFISSEDDLYTFDPQLHFNFVNKFIDDICLGNIKLLKKFSISDCIRAISKNRYNLNFKITYQNDPLSKMSPGKKGLTLLRLLINLSERQWPILLDQPEDDLDNRSVYADLVSFIRKKKNERQIIIVTHNPNLVVGADAEQIIIANQSGQEANRENKTHKFEYVSGSIENSFETPEAQGILYKMGIREHVCDILEGGTEAFRKREAKYQK
ncbi:TrlF family AAA-like ATPase [Fluviispira sanaruensis]|uniref:ATPase AAA-type core domain-containing protein n=1 Tax=Fluviispira sanaruensis TaxID=2493639 RepID=A0A4P2VUE2_FLUSA|nr:hypothetical protein [Fluviispira sanaruensis]BBH53095.1 hypothetical protein JCM31447_15380 [Fluviispira sanaruensis]